MKLFSETGYIGSLALDVKTYNDDYRFKKDTSIDSNFFAFLFFAKQEGKEISDSLGRRRGNCDTIAVGIYNLDFIG